MTKEDVQLLAKGIGDAQGEIASIFVGVLKAMIKSQPNFDQNKFNQLLQALRSDSKITEFQKEILRQISN